MQLILGQRHNGITVPLNALQQGANGALVYVVTPNGMVQQRTVTIDETLNGRALIDNGLRPGDTVVTQGQSRLPTGLRWSRVPAGDPSVQNSTETSAGMLG